MSDLISRADALEAIKLLPVQLDAETVQRCIEAVSNLPYAQITSDARHGTWIPVEDDDMFCYCSECGTHEYRETIEMLRYDYCPYCGAKMDAERKEE